MLPWLQRGKTPYFLCGIILGAAVQVSSASCTTEQAHDPQLHNYRGKQSTRLGHYRFEEVNGFRPVAASPSNNFSTSRKADDVESQQIVALRSEGITRRALGVRMIDLTPVPKNGLD